jgi:hypothetical protein
MKKTTPLDRLRQRTGCLSCGTSEGLGKRRYCSVSCRQQLRYQLNVRSGLLKALNTRYATFYFTDSLLVLDILPYNEPGIFSFLYLRDKKHTPAEDFSNMSNFLGNSWWQEKRRTQKDYLASRHVLAKADSKSPAIDDLKPYEIQIPSLKGNGKALVHLKLSKADLDRPELTTVIKSAFRRQARKHHPDFGGGGESFRRIYQAYEDLMAWADEPTFMRRSGFPDKWFYDGDKHRWVQPAPLGTVG